MGQPRSGWAGGGVVFKTTSSQPLAFQARVVQEASPADYEPERRAESGTGDRRVTIVSGGLEAVPRLGRHTGDLPRSGPMDPSSAAHDPTQAVEAWTDRLSGVAATRRGWPGARDSGTVCAELVARGRALSLEHCVAREVLETVGSASSGLMHEPQLTEPPDAGPLVRWCGRAAAVMIHGEPYTGTKPETADTAKGMDLPNHHVPRPTRFHTH